MNRKHWFIFRLEIGEIVNTNRSCFSRIKKPAASSKISINMQYHHFNDHTYHHCVYSTIEYNDL